MNKNKKNGFTLIELLIVIAIIGILATALVPKLREQLAKGYNAKTLAGIGSFRTAFNTGDVIYFINSDKYAKVTNIISDTKLIIDRSFSTDITTPVQKAGYSIDFTELKS